MFFCVISIYLRILVFITICTSDDAGVFNRYMTGATSKAGTSHFSKAVAFSPGFQWGVCWSIIRCLCIVSNDSSWFFFSFGDCIVVCPTIYGFWLRFGIFSASLKSMLLLVYWWRRMVLAILFWFNVNYCFAMMSYGGIVHYVVFKWWWNCSNNVAFHVVVCFI
jgi:hypothetical protein